MDSAPEYQAEDPPPPYWAGPAVGHASVCCGVCGADIAVNGNSRLIVKCRVCKEMTVSVKSRRVNSSHPTVL